MGAQNFALFFFLPSLGGLLVEFSVVILEARALKCARQASHDSPSNTTKIPREDPERENEIVAGMGKKSAKFRARGVLRRKAKVE